MLTLYEVRMQLQLNLRGGVKMHFTVLCWLVALVAIFFQAKAHECKGKEIEVYTIALGISTVGIAGFCIAFTLKLFDGIGATFELMAIGVLLAVVIYDMFKITKLSM